MGLHRQGTQAIGLELLANGELRLRAQRSLPMSEAAEAHRLREEDGVREKLLLTTADHD